MIWLHFAGIVTNGLILTSMRIVSQKEMYITGPLEEVPVKQITPNYRKAVICSLAASGLFMLMYACIKMLEREYPTGEILFSRSFFALLPLIPGVVAAGGLEAFKTKYPGKHLTRGLLGLAGAYLCFSAITALPLSEATPLFHTSPIITTMLAVPLLGELVTWRKAVAILVGFAGVLCIMQPQAHGTTAGAAMALASAFLGACVGIELSRLGKTEKSITIVLYFMLICATAGALSMCFNFVMPSAKDAGMMVLIGVIGGYGQILMTESYKEAPASIVAPLAYSQLIWAALLDLVLWGKTPPVTTIIGALIIATSGISLVRQK